MNDATGMSGNSPLASLRQYFRNLGQKKGEVLVREPGARMFGAPVDVHIEADRQWEYAALSQVVYDKAEASKTHARRGVPLKPDYSKRSFDPNMALAEGDRSECEQFPGEELKPKPAKRHLRVEVWRKSDPTEVAVVSPEPSRRISKTGSATSAGSCPGTTTNIANSSPRSFRSSSRSLSNVFLKTRPSFIRPDILWAVDSPSNLPMLCPTI
ncbi:hypothetical protein AWB79_05047 [Caballeronia hypogeia]|uniref:Uncharacterized protein n=1 Tax=Caballeronia hypogeia TaxID=1777140 RepID=A0A158CAX2_9BURK|nr:hypothetical protein [Caballeronia hypogeia]SAK79518.1 hypothetical protein AWB79_05047 [Caballeronia hypogeia]